MKLRSAIMATTASDPGPTTNAAVPAPDQRVQVVHDGAGIARVTLNRPAKLNALDRAMWLALAEAFERLGADDAVRVVLLSGAGGRAFSVGADIAEFEATRGSRDAALGYAGIIHAATAAIDACPHPIIAAIDGACVGGGMELAAHADIRVAAEGSRFGVPVSRLGLPVDWDEMAALARCCGRSNALAMLLEGAVFDADRALRHGFIHDLLPRERFPAEVEALAARVAAGAPLVARMHKRMMSRLAEPAPLAPAEREAPFSLFSSEDYRIGVRAFLAREVPRFVAR
jgi:enoyl-CoA hydratase/carnithine racemase